MEPTTNPTPTLTSDDGVFTNEVTKLSNSPHSSEKEDGVDFSLKQGSESTEALDTEDGSRSIDNNQSSGTEDVVRAKDLQAKPDSVDDDVETVIKNQHKYYIYCPCCGEDITKTVKLVKISDNPPTKNHETESQAIDTEKGSTSTDKKTKVPSWFPSFLKPLFPSVYGHVKGKGEKGIDSKLPGTYDGIDINGKDPSIDINGKEPSIDVNDKKDRPSFPKWYLDAFAWLFLCIITALSVLFISPPPIIQPHMQLPAIPSLRLPSVSVLSLLPTSAVLILFIISMRSRFSPRLHEKKGDKKVDSKSTEANSEEQSPETQFHNDPAADTDQDFEKKSENQKTHLTPIYPSSWRRPSKQIVNKETHENAENQKNHLTPICLSPRKRPSKQIINKETHEIAEIGIPANAQAEPVSQPNAQPEIPNSFKGTKLEILKSVVYGGLTESITSLCTVTSAAASGASTLNVLALGVANLSSGLLLTVHSLQELINEKPKREANSDDQKKSESDEEDRYEETLGRRENSRIHKLIAIASFVIFGLIPPLVYGFSFRRRIEKRQDYKVIAVYVVSLLCIVLLSLAKAYVSKRREYMKSLFRYTTMAATASGFSQFVGYMISQWLEKSGFYDDSPENTSL